MPGVSRGCLWRGQREQVHRWSGAGRSSVTGRVRSGRCGRCLRAGSRSAVTVAPIARREMDQAGTAPLACQARARDLNWSRCCRDQRPQSSTASQPSSSARSAMLHCTRSRAAERFQLCLARVVLPTVCRPGEEQCGHESSRYRRHLPARSAPQPRRRLPCKRTRKVERPVVAAFPARLVVTARICGALM